MPPSKRSVSDPREDLPASPPATFRPPLRAARRPLLRGVWNWVGLLVVVAGVYGVLALLKPWAMHMGNRSTPFGEWEGVGIIHSSSGARDALYLRIGILMGSGPGRHPTGHSSDFDGEALIRTPQGETIRYKASGDIKTWWSADGKPLSVRLISQGSTPSHHYFDLYGAFQGSQLVLDDHGSTGRMFRPDGSLDPLAAHRSSTNEHPWARVTLDYGSRDDFEALARGLGAR
jgi:hypothetical protein